MNRSLSPLPSLSALVLLLAGVASPVARAQQDDELPTASSSIVDALSAEDDPVESAGPVAEEQPSADEELAEPEELAEAPEEEEEEEFVPEPTPLAPAPEIANRSTAPAVFMGGGVDPITGVELGSSGLRQAAHIIIRREERAEGRHEISLSNPVQVNGKFTQHLGASLDYLYHLREAFAFGVGGSYNYYAVQSSFTEDELIRKAKQQPFTSSALLLDWEGHAGIEVSPMYGKFALFDWRVVQFGFYFGAAGGVGHTRVQLRSADPAQNRGRTFGDTGLRPVGLFSAGMRMFFGQHIAVRLELRDTIYSAAVTSINGCTKLDVDTVKAGGTPQNAACDPGAFLSKDADGAIAADLLKEPSSDILHNVAFVGALSVLF